MMLWLQTFCGEQKQLNIEKEKYQSIHQIFTDQIGLELHHLKAYAITLKTTWMRKILWTNRSWTILARHNMVEMCVIYGDNYLETR